MPSPLSSRFVAELGHAISEGDILKREIMEEAIGRAKNGEGADLEDAALKTAIQAILDPLRIISTGRAKRAFEILGPYLH